MEVRMMNEMSLQEAEEFILALGNDVATFLVGEPGVGKTALIEHSCALAVSEDWRVVRVLGAQAEESFALGGLNQLAIGLEDCRAELNERDRAVLAPVLSGDTDTEVSVLPLAAALLNLLAVAAQTRPVLLVVDDVHWLDSISAEVLGAVGRRLGQGWSSFSVSDSSSTSTMYSGEGVVSGLGSTKVSGPSDEGVRSGTVSNLCGESAG